MLGTSTQQHLPRTCSRFQKRAREAEISTVKHPLWKSFMPADLYFHIYILYIKRSKKNARFWGVEYLFRQTIKSNRQFEREIEHLNPDSASKLEKNLKGRKRKRIGHLSYGLRPCIIVNLVTTNTPMLGQSLDI